MQTHFFELGIAHPKQKKSPVDVSDLKTKKSRIRVTPGPLVPV